MSVSCRVDGELASVSFTTFRKTLLQQIMDSSLAFFKISPVQGQTAQLVLGGKQVVSFTAQSTVEELKLTTPDRQALELVLLDEVRLSQGLWKARGSFWGFNPALLPCCRSQRSPSQSVMRMGTRRYCVHACITPFWMQCGLFLRVCSTQTAPCPQPPSPRSRPATSKAAMRSSHTTGWTWICIVQQT